MDRSGDRRPPRAARPSQRQSQSPAPTYPEQSAHPPRQQYQQLDSHRGNVSFQHIERGDRQAEVDTSPPRQRSAYQNQPSPRDPEANDYDSRVGRKKSLVRPDREKIEPGHRQWHYRTHVAQLEEEGASKVGVLPSTTGNYPLRRGRSLLAREEDVHESGLSIFRRGTHLRRRRQSSTSQAPILPPTPDKNRSCFGDYAPGPKGPWMLYCFIITCWIPTPLMRTCGLRNRDQQRAWREKMGLVSIIMCLMAGVGFVTFGFTESVCGAPPPRFHGGQIGDSFIGRGSVTINGHDYDLSTFKHPATTTVFNGSTNPLTQAGFNAAGNDLSFMFQKTNENCLGLLKKTPRSAITGSGDNMDWYFPCTILRQDGSGTVNLTGVEEPTNCHIRAGTRRTFGERKPQGQVYYTWEDVKNSNRNLAVYESSVIDLDRLRWLAPAHVTYPSIFEDMKNKNGTFNGRDITMLLLRSKQQNIGHCLEDIARVGFIDTDSIGCVASKVVLYVSLVFIIGVVMIRFVMAVMFSWFFSWKLGNFSKETYDQRMQRSAEIENWSNDIYRPAPSQYRPTVNKAGLSSKEKRKTFLPMTSRFTPTENKGGRPMTMFSTAEAPVHNPKRSTYAPSMKSGVKGTPPESPSRGSRSTMSFMEGMASRGAFMDNQCPFPLHNVVPQPAAGSPEAEPFGFPLAHTICLVTAYSESVEGLRTTLDSLATTDYPNSHKLILIIADGMVKGAGNTLTTPEICLTMMKDLIISVDDVEPHSYVAIADGHKRHNMAKVYAGFYDYDDATVERSKQQRVPIVLVAKVGNPLEINDGKPGNRGKRDSQIVLMAFMQKVMFDERMTTFEYEFFNSIWRVTGVIPDRFELVLCVDADTKVFPDSLTRMVSCMVLDEEIMGLCGETKIANKAETFVTMMQVFEYYISHHMTKAFESMFGGVTCLPGCFSMYRIKAPKGEGGYWVPILANPDIVEHYSENVVDTLHKKNLLLLGEDRYLTTLMLKTFPKRKNMFCPQAVCKTVVPDTFRILLSQRRRWINSTIHNLSELVLVRDLCGTFCFSMQFVVGMELLGTLVLPAAIAFTIYLIVDSAIPGGTDTTIPLILLAFVLGLPGLLIVITSRKVAYLGWMFVYLLSLPIWNGILPAYAFWHFDDFSWGQTRKIAGDPGDSHGDKEGEFDSSHIVMKRWAEFERERRWKNGVGSRDSQYRPESNRYSLASNSDLTHPTNNFDSSTADSSTLAGTPPNARSRADSSTLLMLPAPLSNPRGVTSSHSSSMGRSSDDHLSDGSHARLMQSPEARYNDGYESPGATSRSSQGQPIDPSNPFYATSPTGYESEPMFSPDSLESSSHAGQAAAYASRGVRLTDGGPVPGPEGVKRVSRSATKQPRSQSQNRYSRNSTVFNLPPGAAPPNPHYGS